MHWVGVDVGGTFTDVVVYDEATGTLTVGKSPTTATDLPWPTCAHSAAW